jgi:hypothetical protein
MLEKEIINKLQGESVQKSSEDQHETEYDQMIIDGINEFKKYVEREFSKHPKFQQYFSMIQWKGFMNFKMIIDLILTPNKENLKSFMLPLAVENNLILTEKQIDDIETFAQFFIGMANP